MDLISVFGCVFFQFFDCAVNYFTCTHVANVGPKDLLSLHLELVHLLLKEV